MLRYIAGLLLGLQEPRPPKQPWRCARGHHAEGLRRIGPARYEFLECVRPGCPENPRTAFLNASTGDE